MTDKERVQLMRDCNWKPANQYWRELYLESQQLITKLKLRIQELEQ